MERLGCRWERAYKGSGSRVQGWEAIKGRFEAAKETPLERPGLWIFDTCRQWLRTVPMLPRDKRNADDVDSNSEDHSGDAMSGDAEDELRAILRRNVMEHDKIEAREWLRLLKDAFGLEPAVRRAWFRHYAEPCDVTQFTVENHRAGVPS